MRGLLLILLLLTGCGEPLIPDKIVVDAPEEITVNHKITWEFVDEYCNNTSGNNQELEECISDFVKRFKI